MTRTTSPAPYGSPGLEFGNTSEYPYSPNRPHGGQDHQWLYADPNRSKQTFASVTGRITAAYDDGGDHNGWGNYVDIKVPTTDGTSVHARLAHHATGTVQVNVGDWVVSGESRIGIMGDTGEAGGVHLHEELWINGRRVDPVYYRNHDIPGTPSASDGGSNPFNPNVPVFEEDNTMLMLRLKGGASDHLVALGEGIFRHFLPNDPYEFIKNVSRSQDDWQDVPLIALPALLRTYGCDLNIWDFRKEGDLNKSVSGSVPNSVFVVLDPLNNTVLPGNMWSAAGVIRSKLEVIKVTSGETAAYVRKLNIDPSKVS